MLDLVYFEFSFFEFEGLDNRMLVHFELAVLDFRFYFKIFTGLF